MAIPARGHRGGHWLLLTFIGLQNSGFVAANPATIVGVGAPITAPS
jgi:xanthine/uracil/vitamin C permease (AzgA family)